MPDIPQPIIPHKYLMLVTFLSTEEIVIVHLPEGFCQWHQYIMHLLSSLAVFCPVFVNTGVFLVFHEIIAIRAPKMAVTSTPFISSLLLFLSLEVTAINKETKFLKFFRIMIQRVSVQIATVASQSSYSLEISMVSLNFLSPHALRIHM